MPWLTVADATNKHIDDASTITQTRALLYGTVIQQRKATRMVVRYTGIDRAAVEGLYNTIKETEGTQECKYSENDDGSATIHHTVETPVGDWETV